MPRRILLLLSLVLYLPSAQAAESLAWAAVEYREVAQTYSAEGVIEAAQQSTVSAQIAGRVKDVYFDVGDRVKKGQLILRIDQREAAQVVAGSQALVMQTQAALQNAKSTYERARQLYTQKFISQAALDKAQADYKVALAQAAVSEAGAGQSALVQGYTEVTAPYGGVVSARHVEVGEMVTIGKPLMTGFDPAQLRATVDVPQQQLPELSVRPQAMVEFPGLQRSIRALAVTILPLADASTHTTPVRLSLPPGEVGVYPGMSVRIHFLLGKSSKLLIPANSVVHRSEVVAVYVVDERNVVSLRQVRVGKAVAEGVEVLAGLKAGERVALEPFKAAATLSKQAR